MPITAEQAASEPLLTDEHIRARVADLLGTAYRRQVWLLFLDDRDVQLPMLLPIADYPPAPGDAAHRLADAASAIAREIGAAAIVVVWERRLGEQATRADTAWASRLAACLDERSVRVRAQLLCHRGGVRLLDPAD